MGAPFPGAPSTEAGYTVTVTNLDLQTVGEKACLAS